MDSIHQKIKSFLPPIKTKVKVKCIYLNSKHMLQVFFTQDNYFHFQDNLLSTPVQNKDKLSINGADVKKDRTTTSQQETGIKR